MTYTVQSPDETIEVSVSKSTNEEHLDYSVSHRGTTVVEPSPIAFDFEHQPSFGPDVRVVDVRRTVGAESWEPTWGGTDAVSMEYAQLTVEFEDKSGDRQVTMIVRVLNDGVGFHFRFGSGFGAFVLSSERTRFRFDDECTTWSIPGGTNRYEELYRKSLLSEIDTASTPLTLKTTDGSYVAVHEAELRDYAGMELRSASGGGLETDLVALPNGSKVKAIAPHETPWRVLIMGDSAGDLVESHLVEALNPPCALTDTSWIDPGKYVGVWWELHKGAATWEDGPDLGATTERTKEYVDFAAEHDIPYVLAEGWNVGWQGWADDNVDIDDVDYTASNSSFDLDEVLRYAGERDVDFIVHNETFGQAPTYDARLDKLFGWYDELGVLAVKTGYVGAVPGDHPHHDQWMVNHYRRVAERGAAHELMIDAHEPIKPTGETRTYPNFVTFEGVRGMEYNAWSEGNPPSHTVTIPFTRMLAGPLDYTPGVFEIEWDPDKRGTRVHSTRARQLALYPMLLSPLQMIADLPDHCESAPSFEFVEAVPTDWDETVVINDAIGEYATIARRNGDEWFVGTGTDEQSRVVDVPLEFLSDGEYVAHIYTDGAEADLETNPTDVEITHTIVTPEDTLHAAVVPGGGQAVRLTPASSTDTESYAEYVEPEFEYGLETSDTLSPEGVLSFDVLVENVGSLVGRSEFEVTVTDASNDRDDPAVSAARTVRVGADDTVTVPFKFELEGAGTYTLEIDEGKSSVHSTVTVDRTHVRS